ncbi:prolyl aminopeptidase [Aminobacter anthyllidis]|nr:prolyl aminopeptidase [Aminobacter anthyllidis]
MDTTQALRELWPAIEPYRTGRLRVSALHELYFEESGNPAGKPVVLVHGGPGYGTDPEDRRYFDPSRYRIIAFDQRGAGKSTPLGETKENTTSLLVEDMETLRKKLGLDDWMLFGGSWGTTLSIAYAQSHPDRVTAAILRGIWLNSKAEIDWFMSGVSRFFPETWETFASLLPKGERDDVVPAYAKRLQGDDVALRDAAARAWSRYEGSCSTLTPDPGTMSGFQEPHVVGALARIEASYFINEAFLPPNHLMDNMHRMAKIPGVIVQGRYDMVCPPRTAFEVHKRWPASRLEIIPDAGHSDSEPGIRQALLAATEEFTDRSAILPKDDRRPVFG